MSRVVFLVEEKSMAEFIEAWLKRLHPDLPILCVPHEGKKDLLRSIPRKLRAWREPGVRFVVMVDNDGGDCEALKRDLIQLCREAGREDALIRIACQELEAWYLGDPDGLAAAYAAPHLSRELRKTRYRDPDALDKPSAELIRLLPAFQKVSGARTLAAHIDRDRNNSTSFRVFAASIEQLTGDVVPAG